MLRRSRRDVGRELPPVVRTLIDVEASAVSADHRSTMVALAERVLSGERWASFLAAGGLDAMARRVTGLAKAPAVAGLVRHLVESAGEPVLLYGWHHQVYDVWARMLEDCRERHNERRRARRAEMARARRKGKPTKTHRPRVRNWLAVQAHDRRGAGSHGDKRKEASRVADRLGRTVSAVYARRQLVKRRR